MATAAISNFVQALATARLPCPDAHNPYAGQTYRAQQNRTNLSYYLQALEKETVPLLLVGEALGYKGGLHTGIPFSSEALIEAGAYPAGVGCSLRGKPRKEQSAAVVHRYWPYAPLPPAAWNAFPFHPYRAGQPASNRKPRKAEVDLGLRFLQDLLAIVQPRQVAAVGRSAELALGRLKITCTYLRHPAHGGKARYIQQFAQLTQTHCTSKS